MDRAERRRSARVTVITSEGIPHQAISKFSAPLTDPGPGKHLWHYVAMYRCADPSADTFYADLENLLTIEGPGCYKCERMYGEVSPGAPCPGSMTELQP